MRSRLSLLILLPAFLLVACDGNPVDRPVSAADRDVENRIDALERTLVAENAKLLKAMCDLLELAHVLELVGIAK